MSVAIDERRRAWKRNGALREEAQPARWRATAEPDPATKTQFRRTDAFRDSAEVRRLVADAVARAKQGDKDAIGELYLRYSDNIYSYVRVLVGDDHEAEDITQHVFAKLITAITKYEERRVPFWAWILRLARNEAIDHLRRRLPTPVEETRSDDSAAEETPWEGIWCVQAALAALPGDQRAVVVLRHVLGYTPTEIAERLGRSPASIHGLYLRGRRNLRTALLRMDAGPATCAHRSTVAA